MNPRLLGMALAVVFAAAAACGGERLPSQTAAPAAVTAPPATVRAAAATLVADTPAPTASPEPTPAPAPKPGSRAAIKAEMREAWPGDRASEDALLRIVERCENPEMDPRAVSATGDWGITQINRATWEPSFERRFGPWVPNIYDVGKNVRMAWVIYEDAGRSFRPWTCRWAA